MAFQLIRLIPGPSPKEKGAILEKKTVSGFYTVTLLFWRRAGDEAKFMGNLRGNQIIKTPKSMNALINKST